MVRHPSGPTDGYKKSSGWLSKPVARHPRSDVYAISPPKAEPARSVQRSLGFKEDSVLLMPLEDIRSIGPGCKVTARKEKAQVGVGKALLGRVIDGLGNPIDG
jgi:flagellar biosynthesis/type III secretory pathway ATPase